MTASQKLVYFPTVVGSGRTLATRPGLLLSSFSLSAPRVPRSLANTQRIPPLERPKHDNLTLSVLSRPCCHSPSTIVRRHDICQRGVWLAACSCPSREELAGLLAFSFCVIFCFAGDKPARGSPNVLPFLRCWLHAGGFPRSDDRGLHVLE